jgi:hypothetical protein
MPCDHIFFDWSESVKEGQGNFDAVFSAVKKIRKERERVVGGQGNRPR